MAIGASAGGIPAMRRFFDAVPQDPGMAFVVILHLSPTQESHLSAVLQRTTALDVVQVHKNTKIAPNKIYVIPPDAVLTIRDDTIQFRRPRTVFERRHPVDAIFKSLAADRGNRAMCVVLSGSGSNGSIGAQTVREGDGVVLAQDPDTAEHPQMPRNILLAGLADQVLPPEDMPPLLVGYARRLHPVAAPLSDEASDAIAPELNAVLALLRTRGNHDFSGYRTNTLVRRIRRRMGLRHVDSWPQYTEKLRNDPGEVEALVGDLLITVTGFFRDPPAWDSLREAAIVPLVAGCGEGQAVRVWTPACSSGEEAYTMAMLLLETVDAADKRLDVKVFATDPAATSLARARMGVFPGSIAEAIPAELLGRYFDKEDDLYKAKKTLRDAVIFAPQNLLTDPPFSRLDIVSCRNLLIYLQPQVQERLVSLLHFSLREGGYLLLGPAETVGRHADLFEPVSKKWRIYRRIGATRHDIVHFPLLGAQRHGEARQHPPLDWQRPVAEEAREALVANFAPPSVLIDDRSRILYLHGDLDGLLKPPPGEPSLDLIDMTHEELRPRLRAAIRQASHANARATVNATLGQGAAARHIRLSVAPAASQGRARRFLVSFAEHMATEGALHRHRLDDAPLSERQGEEELRTLREELRSTIEQLETSNEELRASNEEISSMNEELQSTNEELETSKEELQSLNEELQTVNAQLQAKVEELEDRTNDLRNLLNSADVATLFLDSELRIRWFSPAVRGLFQIMNSDIGRAISDFAPRLRDESFLKDAAEVLRTSQPSQREVQSDDGRWYLRRILPYRTEDNRIGGVVATFTDISDRKRWEDDLSAAKHYAERIVETTTQPMIVLDEKLHVQSANRAFHETFYLSPRQSAGRSLFDLDDGDWNILELRRALTTAIPQGGVVDLEISHPFKRLGRRHMLVNARRFDGNHLMLVAVEDVTRRKEAEAQQQLLIQELQHRVKNLLARFSAVVSISPRVGSADDFALKVQNRIAGISRTEELIGGRTGNIGLRELVDAELASFSSDCQVQVDGPDLALSSSVAQGLGMILHELATNAAKYGAFLQEDCRLQINWTAMERRDGPRLRLHWSELGVRVQESADRGFGSELMERVAGSLGGEIVMDLADGGLRCTIELPLNGMAEKG